MQEIENQKQEYSDVEKELLVLKCSLSLLFDMLCPDNVLFFKKDARPQTSQSFDLFLILLLDFLSETGIYPQESLFDRLLIISKASKNFIPNKRLGNYLNDFKKWLNKKVNVDMYCSEMSREINFIVSRFDIIKFSGNSSKHNLTRLLRTINNLYTKNNSKLTKKDIFMSLDTIKNDFKINKSLYYFSTIVEFLLNISNSIYYMLRTTTYDNCYKKRDDGSYYYEKPNFIKTEEEFYIFWDLMNIIRTYQVRTLEIDSICKKRY